MATVHFTTLGLSQQPPEADRDGFIKFSREDARKVQLALAKGEPVPECSEGSLRVGAACWEIAQFRGQN
jgi:hypothetical protein